MKKHFKILSFVLICIILTAAIISCDEPEFYAKGEVGRQVNKPSIKHWDYELKWSTNSVLVKAKDMEIVDGVYILDGYYEYANDKWGYRSNTLKLDPALFGEIKVIESPQIEIR